MEFDRREAILLAAATALVTLGGARAEAVGSDVEMPECHQLTRSLIERARRARLTTNPVDTDAIERIIHRMAEGSGGLPIIKWMATPTDAFDHLRKLNSSELGTSLAALWRVRRSCPPCNEDTFERSFRVRKLVSEIIWPDEHDRVLMAPKLRAISDARCAGLSRAELRAVRAQCFQMGWLETCMPAVAADAIISIELHLSLGFPERSEPIRHQLRVFEAYELGLLATWETPAELICVPRTAVA